MDYPLKKRDVLGGSILFLALPRIAFADGIIGIINAAFGVVTSVLIPLAFALCLFYFFWGMVKYIRTGAESEKATEEGKRVMIWGIIGLLVATSIWGIVSFIQHELGIPPIGKVDRPK